MCLRVDAAGYHYGEGNYVSLFLYLMKGPHDDELQQSGSWPLCGNFTIEYLIATRIIHILFFLTMIFVNCAHTEYNHCGHMLVGMLLVDMKYIGSYLIVLFIKITQVM